MWNLFNQRRAMEKEVFETLRPGDLYGETPQSGRRPEFLLRYLFDYLRTPEFNYRHKWQTNDLAVWDNRLSLHYALFDYTDHRLMHRIVIQGDVPY